MRFFCHMATLRTCTHEWNSRRLLQIDAPWQYQYRGLAYSILLLLGTHEERRVVNGGRVHFMHAHAFPWRTRHERTHQPHTRVIMVLL